MENSKKKSFGNIFPNNYADYYFLGEAGYMSNNYLGQR